MSSECLKSFKTINSRIDNIEKLLQLLLINCLIDDAEAVIEVSENLVEAVVGDIISKYGLEFKGYKIINNIKVIILEIPVKVRVSLKELKKICDLLRQQDPNNEPLFMYNKINGMQRKSIIQAGISFGVKGKELHVTKWEARA